MSGPAGRMCRGLPCAGEPGKDHRDDASWALAQPASKTGSVFRPSTCKDVPVTFALDKATRGGPHQLGQEFLGFQVDELPDHQDSDMVSKVIVSAMDATLANWDPASDFIEEDMIFAVGAMSRNQHYVRFDRDLSPTPA
jgi:hypothetical protein